MSGELVRVKRAYDVELASFAESIDCPGPSRTQQSAAKDADINEIVRRFGVTGELPAPREAAQYGDFSQVTDFQSAMEQLRRAQESFDELPAEVRESFGYDPARFVDWVSDPENVADARKRGLLPSLFEEGLSPVSGLPAAAPESSLGAPPASTEGSASA